MAQKNNASRGIGAAMAQNAMLPPLARVVPQARFAPSRPLRFAPRAVKPHATTASARHRDAKPVKPRPNRHRQPMP